MIFTILIIPNWEIWPKGIGQTRFLFHFPISWSSLFPWGEVSKRYKQSDRFLSFISTHSVLLNLRSMWSMRGVSENADSTGSEARPETLRFRKLPLHEEYRIPRVFQTLSGNSQNQNYFYNNTKTLRSFPQGACHALLPWRNTEAGMRIQPSL